MSTDVALEALLPVDGAEDGFQLGRVPLHDSQVAPHRDAALSSRTEASTHSIAEPSLCLGTLISPSSTVLEALPEHDIRISPQLDRPQRADSAAADASPEGVSALFNSRTDAESDTVQQNSAPNLQNVQKLALPEELSGTDPAERDERDAATTPEEDLSANLDSTGQLFSAKPAFDAQGIAGMGMAVLSALGGGVIKEGPEESQASNKISTNGAQSLQGHGHLLEEPTESGHKEVRLPEEESNAGEGSKHLASMDMEEPEPADEKGSQSNNLEQAILQAALLPGAQKPELTTNAGMAQPIVSRLGLPECRCGSCRQKVSSGQTIGNTICTC